jgi:hypothetical protein
LSVQVDPVGARGHGAARHGATEQSTHVTPAGHVGVGIAVGDGEGGVVGIHVGDGTGVSVGAVVMYVNLALFALPLP